VRYSCRQSSRRILAGIDPGTFTRTSPNSSGRRPCGIHVRRIDLPRITKSYLKGPDALLRDVTGVPGMD
jgi:hypothetical protein